MTVCPSCESERVVKNGRIHNGKQNHKCKACSRQFVMNPTKKTISEETRERIARLLLEKLPLAGIARVERVSETWLQGYVNRTYKQVEQQVQVREKKGL
jgi:insertion element IS1 protein InsB